MEETTRERWDEIIAADSSPALQIELLRRFVRDFPESGPGWRLLGRALANISRFDESLRAQQKGLELSKPDGRIFALCDLGTLFRHRGEHAKAEEWFRKVIEESPDDAQGYILLGGMFARLGRLSEAEQLHRRATSCKSGCIDEAFHNLGLVLRAQSRYQEASTCFDSALQIDPKYKDARLAKRDVQRAMKLLDDRAEANPPETEQ